MNKLFRLHFLYIFLLLLLVHLVALAYGNSPATLITKVSIVFSLILYLGFKCKSLYAKPMLILAGLVLSFCGDLVLAFQEKRPAFFMAGLLCFLFAHIFYVLFYRQSATSESFSPKIKSKALWQILIFFYGMGFCLFLSPHLGSLRIPVFVYAFVLMLMNSFALNRSGRVPSKSFYYILTGAVLFTVSDSALAINKFVGAFSYSGVIIMCTYAIAQYLITCGTIFYYQNNKS